jgi:hypothetical protein
MHMLDYESFYDENKEAYAAEFTWLPNDKGNTSASLKLTHNSRDEMKFTLMYYLMSVIKYLLNYLSQIKLKCLTLSGFPKPPQGWFPRFKNRLVNQ